MSYVIISPHLSIGPRLDPEGVGWQKLDGAPPWKPHTGSQILSHGDPGDGGCFWVGVSKKAVYRTHTHKIAIVKWETWWSTIKIGVHPFFQTKPYYRYMIWLYIYNYIYICIKLIPIAQRFISSQYVGRVYLYIWYKLQTLYIYGYLYIYNYIGSLKWKCFVNLITIPGMNIQVIQVPCPRSDIYN
jgi:hypothetical protein